MEREPAEHERLDDDPREHQREQYGLDGLIRRRQEQHEKEQQKPEPNPDTQPSRERGAECVPGHHARRLLHQSRLASE